MFQNFWQAFPTSDWLNGLRQFYLFVLNTVRQQMGYHGYGYFPILFVLFIFILFSNILGMTIYSYTITSHAIITFSLSFMFFIGIVIIGVSVQGWDFKNTFIPVAPKPLLVFLIPIEIVSYFTRPFSLGIRLFANMMSGHTLLAILANFALMVSQKYYFITIVPFILITGIVSLEIMIAILQAYVFVVLICIYINDSLVGH